MPYSSYFPAGYQPMYQTPQSYYPPYGQNGQQGQNAQQVQQPNQQQPMTSGIIWVQGEAGAKSYLVAPNTTVQLWDSENQTIYLKSADASGMPSIKTLDYTIRESSQNSVSLASGSDSTAFATKDEVNVLAEKIEALRGEFDGLSRRAKRRLEVSEDE